MSQRPPARTPRRAAGWDEGATRVAEERGRLTLCARGGGLDGEIFGSDGKPITLGRDESCAIVLPIAESSRRNSFIEYRGGRFWISDLGSLNGTSVNDVLISEPVALEEGDEIAICGQRFDVRLATVEGRQVVVDGERSIEEATAALENTRPGPVPVSRRPPPATPARRSRTGAYVLGGIGFLLAAGGAAFVGFTVARRRDPAAPTPPVVAQPIIPPPLAPPAPPRPAEPTQPAQAMLQAVDAVSLVADAEMTVTKAARRGSRVDKDEIVVDYRKHRPDAEEKHAQLRELEERYASSPEHADFIEAARAEYAQAKAGRVRGTLRAPLSGVVVAAVAADTHVKAGSEVLRVAASLRVIVDGTAVQGVGPACKLRCAQLGDRALDVRLDPAAPDARTRSLSLANLPEDLSLGRLEAVRVTCGPE